MPYEDNVLCVLSPHMRRMFRIHLRAKQSTTSTTRHYTCLTHVTSVVSDTSVTSGHPYFGYVVYCSSTLGRRSR